MEKGNIKIVEIADFKNSEHVLDYVDNDFVIINSLEGSPYNEDTIRLGCFLIAICLEGCIQLDVNYKTYQLEAGDLLLGLPNTIISHAMVSPKHKIRLAAFSTQFLQRVVKMEKDTWNTVMHIHNNPIKSVGEEGDKEIFKFYRELLMAKINDEPHHYHREVMQYLFSAIFCEMLGHLNKEVNPSEMTVDTKESIKQSDYILRKFIEMLSKDNGIHRSVGYYADALCYSPKHFSKVIKQACGLVGLIAGLLVARALYAAVGEQLAPHIGTSVSVAQIISFIIISAVIPALLMLAGAALTRALEAAHLGIVNRMLGAVTGMVLHLLFLGVLIKVVEYIDPDEKMLTPEVKEQSVFYHPVGETAGLFFPAIKQVTEQLIK